MASDRARAVGGDAACVFCDVIAGRRDAHVVAETSVAVAFLDRSPLFKGHVLVAPRRHVVSLGDLADDAIAPLFGLVRDIARVMPDALDGHGTFVAINNIVSQSVPHLHVHVVPRRRKDGLRGFFWPRQRYTDEADAATFAGRLRKALE